MIWLQVTQKYLEYLISKRQYAETAAACAKLLKVSSAVSVLLHSPFPRYKQIDSGMMSNLSYTGCAAAMWPRRLTFAQWLSRDILSRMLPVQDDAAGWERWVYLFAQLRQLPALAPYIPTKEPRLRQTAYEMVLHAFLLSPTDHPRLLDALQRWPPDLYSVPSLTQSVVQR